jgi:hypothetical protein
VTDPTEAIHRARLAQINVEPGDRATLQARYGPVWDTEDLGRDFEVVGFLAPYVVVRRRADNRLGSLEFQHCPGSTSTSSSTVGRGGAVRVLRPSAVPYPRQIDP